MARRSAILDAAGAPMPRVAASTAAFAGADRFSQELARWNPELLSADAALLPERDTLVARARDAARNNGWAAGGLQRHLDTVIGSGLRLSSKPDYRALGQSPDWAEEWSTAVEAKFRLWADDPAFRCDAARRTTFAGLLGLAYRHRLLDGETLALPLWLPDRGGRYALAIQIIDPDRLSNPHSMADSDLLRAGVQLDEYGAPTGYHIRKRHPGDIGIYGAIAYEWDFIPAFTGWGRRRVIHHFESDHAGQTRGRSLLSPVLEKLKMLDRYERTELQAALVNAIFAAFIESPFDHELVAGGLDTSSISNFQKLRSAFHEDRKLTLDGVRIPTLFPGESFNFTSAQRPNSSFGDFEKAVLRYVAAATGQSYEQLSQDWSSTNYSSARAALVEIWKFMAARRAHFGMGVATQIFILWLEEAIDIGDVELPPGAPDFYEAVGAYARCRWIGPGRGWVDPTKEAQASQMRMDAMVSTLEDECAEQGLDWEEVLQQRRRELDRIAELGLPEPSWSVISDTGPAEEGEPARQTTTYRRGMRSMPAAALADAGSDRHA